MDISLRNELCASNPITLVWFQMLFCTFSDVQVGARKSEFSFCQATLFAGDALAHTHMLVFMCVLFVLQREDYCRFTRPGNNEQAHPRDTRSIRITMKHC